MERPERKNGRIAMIGIALREGPSRGDIIIHGIKTGAELVSLSAQNYMIIYLVKVVVVRQPCTYLGMSSFSGAIAFN